MTPEGRVVSINVRAEARRHAQAQLWHALDQDVNALHDGPQRVEDCGDCPDVNPFVAPSPSGSSSTEKGR